MNRKVTIVGGASAYVPVIVSSLLDIRGNAGAGEVCLMDQQPGQLQVICDFSRGLVAQQGSHLQITSTLDLAQALDGADLVITLYRAGGLQARHLDETIPLEYGIIGQETQGFGGFASALRNVPILKTIVTEMQRRCPNAWVINITNPVGIMTKAAIDLGAKAIGICELPYTMQLAIAATLNVGPLSVDMNYIGLNHLGWVTGIRVNGTDVLDTIITHYSEDVFTKARPANIPISIGEAQFTRTLEAIPSPYLCYFYQSNRVVNILNQKRLSRAQEVMAVNEQLLLEYSTPSYMLWRDLIQLRGGFRLGDAAAKLIADIFGVGFAQNHIVCTPNDKTISELPTGVVIEMPVKIINGTIMPTRQSQNLSPHMWGLMSVVAGYETLTARAAITGNYDVALLALATHPLVPTIELARILLDRAMVEFQPFLPQFYA